MLQELTVTYDGLTFHPEETVLLEPNTRYLIQIISQADQTQKVDNNAWDILEKMTGTYEAPEDWSSEHDHYLYGTPKKNSNDEQR